MISNRRKLKTQTSLRGSTQRRRKLLNNHKKYFIANALMHCLFLMKMKISFVVNYLYSSFVNVL